MCGVRTLPGGSGRGHVVDRCTKRGIVPSRLCPEEYFCVTRVEVQSVLPSGPWKAIEPCA